MDRLNPFAKRRKLKEVLLGGAIVGAAVGLVIAMLTGQPIFEGALYVAVGAGLTTGILYLLSVLLPKPIVGQFISDVDYSNVLRDDGLASMVQKIDMPSSESSSSSTSEIIPIAPVGERFHRRPPMGGVCPYAAQ